MIESLPQVLPAATVPQPGPGRRRRRTACAAPPAFTGLHAGAFDFFAELMENNTHDWFEANRTRYREEVDRPWRALVEAIAAPLRLLIPTVDADVKTGAVLSRVNVRWPRPGAAYHTGLQASFRTRGIPSVQPAARLLVTIEADGLRAGLEVPRAAPGWEAVAAALAAGGDHAAAPAGHPLAWTIGGLGIETGPRAAVANGHRGALRYERTWTPVAATGAGSFLADEIWAALQEAAPWYVLAARAEAGAGTAGGLRTPGDRGTATGADGVAEVAANRPGDAAAASGGVRAIPAATAETGPRPQRNGHLPPSGPAAAADPATCTQPASLPEVLVLPRGLRAALQRRAAAEGVGFAPLAVYLLVDALRNGDTGLVG